MIRKFKTLKSANLTIRDLSFLFKTPKTNLFKFKFVIFCLLAIILVFVSISPSSIKDILEANTLILLINFILLLLVIFQIIIHKIENDRAEILDCITRSERAVLFLDGNQNVIINIVKDSITSSDFFQLLIKTRYEKNLKKNKNRTDENKAKKEQIKKLDLLIEDVAKSILSACNGIILKYEIDYKTTLLELGNYLPITEKIFKKCFEAMSVLFQTITEIKPIEELINNIFNDNVSEFLTSNIDDINDGKLLIREKIDIFYEIFNEIYKPFYDNYINFLSMTIEWFRSISASRLDSRIFKEKCKIRKIKSNSELILSDLIGYLKPYYTAEYYEKVLKILKNINRRSRVDFDKIFRSRLKKQLEKYKLNCSRI